MAIDLNDKTVNGNTLTNNNGVTEITTSLPFPASTIAVGMASTSSQYLSAADSASLSLTGNFTIEFWIKFTTLPINATATSLVTKFGVTPNWSFWLDFLHDTTKTHNYNIRMEVSSTGANLDEHVVGFLSDPVTGTWYHMACVFTAASHKLEVYLNGTSQGTDTTGTLTSIFDNTQSLLIGATNTGAVVNFQNGQFDDVRIWNIVRTSTEITNNMSVQLTGNETGLVAYWPFNTLPLSTGSMFFAD